MSKKLHFISIKASFLLLPSKRVGVLRSHQHHLCDRAFKDRKKTDIFKNLKIRYYKMSSTETFRVRDCIYVTVILYFHLEFYIPIHITVILHSINAQQKQPSRGVLIKRCSENMQQIYRKTPVSKCDSNKAPFPKSTSGELKSEYRKIRTRNNSVFEHISRSELDETYVLPLVYTN